MITNSSVSTAAAAADSYRLYCNGSMPTVAYYPASTTCGSTVSTTLGGALYAATTPYAAAVVAFTGGGNVSTYIMKFKATTLKADVCIPVPVVAPASALSTAAAATILAGAALIL